MGHHSIYFYEENQNIWVDHLNQFIVFCLAYWVCKIELKRFTMSI